MTKPYFVMSPPCICQDVCLVIMTYFWRLPRILHHCLVCAPSSWRSLPVHWTVIVAESWNIRASAIVCALFISLCCSDCLRSSIISIATLRTYVVTCARSSWPRSDFQFTVRFQRQFLLLILTIQNGHSDTKR